MSLESLGSRGVKMVRLDAFGYATKKLDTRCFMEVSLLPALCAKVCLIVGDAISPFVTLAMKAEWSETGHRAAYV